MKLSDQELKKSCFLWSSSQRRIAQLYRQQVNQGMPPSSSTDTKGYIKAVVTAVRRAPEEKFCVNDITYTYKSHSSLDVYTLL